MSTVKTMSQHACRACAAAKRRCGRQIPRCQRCKGQGIDCKYPPIKPTRFVLCEERPSFLLEHDIVSRESSQSFACSAAFPNKEAGNSEPSIDLDLIGCPSGWIDVRQASSWFASPETWKICHFSQSEGTSFSVAGLKWYITKIHRWLTRWIENESTEFIHPRLYRTRFPRCIQEAYTALSCYHSKTASNEQIILRIIEYRSEQLLADNGVSFDTWPGTMSLTAATLDPLEHVARVQALLVYQVICLYDGDIRLRHLAEGHIPVLNCWIQEMVENASQAVCLGSSLVEPMHEQADIECGIIPTEHLDNLLWCSWILAESIRRTWLVATSLQAIYSMIQLGQIVPCPGSMIFSVRQGVWEAQSARAWVKLCSEVNVGMIQLEDVDGLFSQKDALVDINDFAKVFFEAVFGVDRMERWGLQLDV